MNSVTETKMIPCTVKKNPIITSRGVNTASYSVFKFLSDLEPPGDSIFVGARFESLSFTLNSPRQLKMKM